NGDVQAKYDYYKGLVEANQGKIEDGVDTVLGLRGLGKDGTRHDSAQNIGPYNDTFVLLSKDGAGQPSVTELTGSTHAGQKSSTVSPDGVAQLRPGSFQATPHGEHDGMPSWHITTQSGDDHVPAWRDVNKDGYISGQEKAQAEKAGTTATAILFHNGKFADHGSSIGCQVMPPEVMQSFISLVGVDKSFNYTLVDANVATPRCG
ncbi:unnamed protein product, partial [Phaeothamnion confervicola]